MLKLLQSNETKNYASNAVKHAVPMLVQAGLGFAVPFLCSVNLSFDETFLYDLLKK
jgi:hypothetical protein